VTCCCIQPQARQTRGLGRISLKQGRTSLKQGRQQRARALLVTKHTVRRTLRARVSPCRLALLAAVLRGPEPARRAAPLLQHHGQPALLRRVDPARRPAPGHEQSFCRRRGAGAYLERTAAGTGRACAPGTPPTPRRSAAGWAASAASPAPPRCPAAARRGCAASPSAALPRTTRALTTSRRCPAHRRATAAHGSAARRGQRPRTWVI